MKKKILIIGSDGYLGSRMLPYLRKRGFDCKAHDIGFFRDCLIANTEKEPNVNDNRFDARHTTQGDILGFDAVIMLAGISNDPLQNLSSKKIYDPTRDYALKIASLCKKLGVKFIFPSSCSVYGASEGGLHDEESSTNPQTAYSRNKLEIEDGLKGLSGSGFNPIALRLGTVYGPSPRIRFDVVVNMLTAHAMTTGKITLNSDGQAWRPHLHIDDACKAFECAINTEPEHGLNILNVGDKNANLRVIDVAGLIKEVVPDATIEFLGGSNLNNGSKIADRKITDGKDTRTYQVSFDKIQQVYPDFSCKWSVKDGVRHLVSFLEANQLQISHIESSKFYRLQYLEKLHDMNLINDDLCWVEGFVK